MAGFIIYALDNTNNKAAYEIYNIECTVDDLLNDILKINRCWEVVTFNEDELNYMNKDTMLADIGLDSECTVVIKNKVLSENEQLIIDSYSKEALEAFKIHKNLEDEDIKFNDFSSKYIGKFNDINSAINDMDSTINDIKNRHYLCFNVEFFRIDSFGTIIYLKNNSKNTLVTITVNNFNNHYFQFI